MGRCKFLPLASWTLPSPFSLAALPFLHSWVFHSSTRTTQHKTQNTEQNTQNYCENTHLTSTQGLRGLASVSVVITHLARAFDAVLFYPNTGPLPDNAPRLLQWPIIRVFIHGRIGIAIFALVTGYVCALKPIRQSKAGNIEGALSSVAKSAFRRIPRLFLPTTMATLIMWLVAQLGAYEVANHADSFWLRTTSPDYQPTWSLSVTSLFREILLTWTNHSNDYDPNQWTLQPLLKGSMMIYMLIFGTIYMQQRYRMWASLAFYFYFFFAGEGMSVLPPPPNHRMLASRPAWHFVLQWRL